MSAYLNECGPYGKTVPEQLARTAELLAPFSQRAVSTKSRELKRVLWLRDTRGQVVEVAVIMRPGPSQSPATGGDIHIALHPLGRRPRADDESA